MIWGKMIRAFNLTGSTFDNNQAMTSTGQISGYGTFRTGGLSNEGKVTFTGDTTIDGDVTNEEFDPSLTRRLRNSFTQSTSHEEWWTRLRK